MTSARPAFSCICLAAIVVAIAPTSVRAQEPTPDLDLPPPSGVGSSTSLYIGVPFFGRVDRDVVRPGASIEGRSGLVTGPLIPEIELGFQTSWIDLAELGSSLGSEPLTMFYVGLGARVPLPWVGRLTPYLSGAFDIAWWHFEAEDLPCSQWYCSSDDRYHVAPGFSGRGGFEIALSSLVALDTGVRIAMSLPGTIFDDVEWWFAPYIGITLNGR